jgi:nucleolar protein 9
MPKEQVRKRGKRKTKQADEGESRHAAPVEVKIDVRPFHPDAAPHQQQQYSAPSQPVAGPSAIHPARAALLSGQRYVPPPAAASTSASAPADFVPLGDGQPAADPENGEAQWNRGPRADQEFPFGIVDPDLKAYFRGVEEQIKDWEGTSSVGEEREGKLDSSLLID